MSDAPEEGLAGHSEATAGRAGKGKGVDDRGESARGATPGQGEDTQPIASAVPPPPMLLPPPPEAEPSLLAAPPAAPLDRPPRPPAPAVVAPAVARRANPAAVTALIVGIVAVPIGMFFVTAPLGALFAVLALVFGAIGITRTRKANASGMGMAIIGMVTGLIGLVAASVWLAVWIGLNGAAEETGGLAQQIRSRAERIGPTSPVSRLSIGDCYDDLLGDSGAESVSLIDCGLPHRKEVFAQLRVGVGPGAVYPGVTELRRSAENHCKSEPFTDFVGAHYFSGSPLMVDTIFPSRSTWANGDRDIICVISDPAGPVTGTMRDSERRPELPVPTPVPSPLPVYPVAPASLAPPS
ncbi:MAG: septum formation family protein [Egibacteraceae bacterium]